MTCRSWLREADGTDAAKRWSKSSSRLINQTEAHFAENIQWQICFYPIDVVQFKSASNCFFCKTKSAEKPTTRQTDRQHDKENANTAEMWNVIKTTAYFSGMQLLYYDDYYSFNLDSFSNQPCCFFASVFPIIIEYVYAQIKESRLERVVFFLTTQQKAAFPKPESRSSTDHG